MRFLFALPALLLFTGFLFKPVEQTAAAVTPVSKPTLTFWLFWALALALFVMALQPMNFDEHWQLSRELRGVESPPGNHWLARYFLKLGFHGTGEVWVGTRIFSLAFSWLTLAFWYRAATAWLRPTTALWFTGALFANGLFLFNAVSSRGYALGILLTTVGILPLLAFVKTREKHWAILSTAAVVLLLAAGASTHRMTYFVFSVGFTAFLIWGWRGLASPKKLLPWIGVAVAAVIVGWPFLRELFVDERNNGLLLRAVAAGAMSWNRLETISFFYAFGWDRSWQSLLGIAFVASLLMWRRREPPLTYGEMFWAVLLLALPFAGWIVGDVNWEPRFFIFFIPPCLFFLGESFDRLAPKARRAAFAEALVLFVAIPLFQAPRLFINSGGQADLVNFLDVAAQRYAKTGDSCLACSGSTFHCNWVKHIYLPEARGFTWGAHCAHPWVVRLAGNDQIPLPAGRLALNFRYREDYLLYESLAP